MATPELTTNIFDMECAKNVVDQYMPILSMPEVENDNKERFDKH